MIMTHRLFRTKNIESILKSAEEPEHQLRRSLGVVSLTALGIGAIIGAGIFAATGSAAAGSPDHLGAGPAIILSFVVTAIACGFAALCYAEFSSMLPISGSAYTYSYASFGELIAWVIGWDLILEYAVGNIAVAVSWSGYFVSLLSGFGIHLPAWASLNYNTMLNAVMEGPGRTPEMLAAAHTALDSAPQVFGIPIIINVPAVFIVTVITIILVLGIRESAALNSFIVVLKILIVGFFIAIGIFYVKPENWIPFAPNGWNGVMTGAALVFFAYIGFDAVTTTAEEARNPQRDIPRSMILSLVICTILYIGIALVLTGLVPSLSLNVSDPLAFALHQHNLDWASGIISFGAVISMTAVILVFQLGQPRIFFSMSRDGLLPPAFAKVHPRFKTPYIPTILTGLFVAIPAAFLDITAAVEFTNIGTLFAFVLVCAGVIILRKTRPDCMRKFRTPWVPVIPILGILSCLYLMISLPWITWMRFFFWLFLGTNIYFLYGIEHSKLSGETSPDSRRLLLRIRAALLGVDLISLIYLYFLLREGNRAVVTVFEYFFFILLILFSGGLLRKLFRVSKP
ncbi:MAG: amino acid permease [Bacteroidota bacterium]